MTAPTKLVYVRAKKDTEGHTRSITVNKRSDPRGLSQNCCTGQIWKHYYMVSLTCKTTQFIHNSHSDATVAR